MVFWIFMLFAVLVTPVIMIGFGKSFMKGNPKNINDLYGYRTARSMKNAETWRFAHDLVGRLWCKWGLILFHLTIPAMMLFFGRSIDIIGIGAVVIMIIQGLIMLILVIIVESSLKKEFDEYGNRK